MDLQIFSWGGANHKSHTRASRILRFASIFDAFLLKNCVTQIIRENASKIDANPRQICVEPTAR